MSREQNRELKQRRLGLFWKKYLRLSRGGVPALRAIAVIEEEETDPDMKATIATMAQALGEGQSLSEAMRAHPEVFSPSALAFVRSAEQHGQWDAALSELADGLLEGTFD